MGGVPRFQTEHSFNDNVLLLYPVSSELWIELKRWFLFCLVTIPVRKEFRKLYLSVQFSSVAQSYPTLQPHEWQHARPPCPSPTPRTYPNSCLLSRWCHPTIYPMSSPSPLSQRQGLFKKVSSSHEVAKVLEFQLQYHSYQWTPRTDLL